MELSKDMERFDDLLLVAIRKAIWNKEPDVAFSLLMTHIVWPAQALNQAGACTKADIERVFKHGLQDALLDAPEITRDS